MKNRYYSLKLALICIIVFILQAMIKGFTELFVLNENSFFQPWRFVSAIFLHGSLLHLLYNMFALALFGLFLEGLIGSKRFVLIFLVSGILANLVSILFYPSSLGASGAIFGVIGALIVIRPLLIVWAFGLPMPIFVAGILWAAGDLMGAIGFLAGNPIDNTGNIAHLSGMFFGLLFGSLYRDWAKRREKRGKIRINERYMRGWEDNYLNRRFVTTL